VYFTLTFANLSNPGWHPEYGFQLTYVAIAIDKDGKPNSGETNVGMNSNYVLEPSFAFEDIIYVGGGIRLMDSGKKILGEYLPTAGDEKNPIGNVTTKTIEFSLPQKMLGAPSNNWRYVVLVGCQDDHGGAGVGEFRSVEATPGEWIGGGKKHPSDPNVYDVIVPGK
jgi:carbohydrate-binding DOMON domain-containing protein